MYYKTWGFTLHGIHGWKTKSEIEPDKFRGSEPENRRWEIISESEPARLEIRGYLTRNRTITMLTGGPHLLPSSRNRTEDEPRIRTDGTQAKKSPLVWDSFPAQSWFLKEISRLFLLPQCIMRAVAWLHKSQGLFIIHNYSAFSKLTEIGFCHHPNFLHEVLLRGKISLVKDLIETKPKITPLLCS